MIFLRSLKGIVTLRREKTAVEMKIGFTVALILAASLAAGQAYAQTQSAGSSSSSSQDQSGQKQPVAAPQPAAPEPSTPHSQAEGNPFPGNTTSVPILPSGPNGNIPQAASEPGFSRAALPGHDSDPVLSPDSTAPDSGEIQGFSSSLTGIGSILPPPDDTNGKKGGKVSALPVETPENDIHVGNYYLSVKNWRAALSRFQSALVLEPNNADVYWGLAESERHLGDYALAREHYLKVLEYDPGTKRSKKAIKALRDPQIANAKPSTGGQASAKR